MQVQLDGAKVRAMREARGMNRQEFAEAAGITPKTLGRAEGQEVVQLRTARKVARALGVADPKCSAHSAWRA